MPEGFTLYTADCVGNADNCYYPHPVLIDSKEKLQAALKHDFVCAKYAGNHRSVSDFIVSDCLALDVDNDHTEDENAWVRPEDIHWYFPDVMMGIHYSRHHMKQKGKEGPRPRFHVLFASDPEKAADIYKGLKARVEETLPCFDPGAMDAARFFFGTPGGECEFYPGNLTINECLDQYFEGGEVDVLADVEIHRTIPQGSRNATMSHFAGRILKRLGATSEAHEQFLQRAALCDPPLEDDELNHIWRSALGFYEKVRKQPGYLAPDAYGTDERGQFDPEDRTDVGQARMLAKNFKKKIRFSLETDFLFYDGITWNESEPDARGVVHALTDIQLSEAQELLTKAHEEMHRTGADMMLLGGGKSAVGKLSDEQLAAYNKLTYAEGYKKWILKYRDSGKVTATMNESKPRLLINVDKLDADALLLNCPSATYDLRKGMAGRKEHDYADYCTKVTAADPSDEGKKLWDDSLELFFCGDQELMRYVQKVCGLMCIGKVYREEMIIATGEGSNGKSTFWNTIYRVLGTYGKTIAADTLTTGCKRNTLPEMATLRGQRMLLASELQEGMSLNTATIKQLTSTDPIHAEAKYYAPFDFRPTHSLVLYTNHLPKVRATDKGIWRRLIVVPFNASIEGKGDIKNYAEVLYEQARGPVMKWLIEGAQAVIRDEFRIEPPECVKKATAEYRESNNWFANFLGECCEVAPDASEKSGQLYMAYRNWCSNCGEYAHSTTNFYDALKQAGFERVKKRDRTYVLGLKLKQDDDELLG